VTTTNREAVNSPKESEAARSVVDDLVYEHGKQTFDVVQALYHFRDLCVRQPSVCSHKFK